MGEKIKTGSTKRFGARYGRRIRSKLEMVEKVSKMMHKCPYCNCTKVKKLSTGIYSCRKCKSKFAGKAYSPLKKVFIVQQKKIKDEETIEEDTTEDEGFDEIEEKKPKKKEKDQEYEDDDEEEVGKKQKKPSKKKIEPAEEEYEDETEESV